MFCLVVCLGRVVGIRLLSVFLIFPDSSLGEFPYLSPESYVCVFLVVCLVHGVVIGFGVYLVCPDRLLCELLELLT